MRRRMFLVCAVALCGAVILTAAAPKEAAKIRVLLVTGCDVPSHRWYETSPELRKILLETGRFEVVISEEPEVLAAEAIFKYDVIVINYMNWRRETISDAAKRNLLRFTSSGKGLVPFHFTAAAFREWDDEYIPLIGRAWRKGSGHGPRGKFMVDVADEEHPITKGLKSFETDDELYAKLVGDKKIHVLVTADSKWSKRTEPIAFIHEHGKGRVYNIVLGHDVAALKIPGARTLFWRGTEWAATGTVKD